MVDFDRPSFDIPTKQENAAAPAAESSAAPISDKEAAKLKAQSFGRLQTSHPELSADKMDYEGENKAKIIASGSAKIKDKNFELDADKIEYSGTESLATASGDVRISQDYLRMVSNELKLKTDENSISAEKLRLGHSPLFIEANNVAGTKQTITSDSTSVIVGQPDMFSINMQADKMTYTPETTTLELEDTTFRIGQVPFFYLPYVSHDNFTRPPFMLDIQPGYNGDYGFYIRDTVYYTGLDYIDPGILLDYYSKRSVLVGPAANYNYTSSFTNIVGSWQAGFINDGASDGVRGYDDLGRQVQSDRFFINGKHMQTFGDSVILTGQLYYWKDQHTLRDFRPDDFYDNQIPDNFGELVYYGSFFNISAFSRFQPNDWEIVQQRLPELRFDMQPTDPFGIKLYHDAFVSVGYYREFDPYNSNALTTSKRIDAFYGISRPISFNSWSSITPILGVRVTHYADAYGKSSDYTRMLGQFGFDAQMDVWGTWDYTSQTMNIDGLRHNLRPVMSYRYIPSASQGLDRIPQIDTLAFSSYPSMLDLGLQRNTDLLTDTNTLRMGLENILQTRDSDGYGSRTLARLDFYQDFNFEQQPYLYPDYTRGQYINVNRTSYSDFYTHLSLSPARWLTVGGYSRIDVNYLDLPELNTYIRLHDADHASVTFFSTYLNGYINQYGLEAQYKISENYRLIGRWHYDYNYGDITDQVYTLWTRLGNSWIIEYQLGYRKGALREDNLSVGARVHLLIF